MNLLSASFCQRSFAGGTLTMLATLVALAPTDSPAAAQQVPVRVQIEGVVIDSATHAPIGSARLMPVAPGQSGALSDERGRFALSLLVTDSIRLVVDQIGYGTVRLALPIAAASSPIEVAFGV